MVSSLWSIEKVGKGSRQNRSVTSGKGLALRVVCEGLCSHFELSRMCLTSVPDVKRVRAWRDVLGTE